MVDDLDSIDDILLEPKETTGQVAGRFRPKARAKTTKVIVGPSKASVVEPQCSDSGVKQQKGSILPCSVLGSCTTAPDHNVVQEPVDQSQIIDSVPLTSIGGNKEVLGPHLPSSREDADALFDMDSIDDLINPVSTTATAVGIFEPETNRQPKSKKTAIPPSVLGVVESMDASTVSSSVSDLDVISSELHEAHAAQQQNEEAVIHIDTSHDVLQVSEIDTKLHLDLDKSEEILEFCSREFQEDTIFQISETLAVEPVRKFQPKQRQKERKGKSVSFVLPEACEAAAPVETCSQTRDSNGLDLPIQTMVSDENFGNGLQPSTTIADGSGEFCQNLGEEIFFSERQHFDESEDVGNEVRSQHVEDLTQQKLERPRSGNLGDVRASKPSDNDLDIGDSNISQMDEDISDASDDEYKAEDTTKRKRVPAESRKKKNENEKPTQKHKRTFKKSDRPLEGLPKEKLFHRVRQKRRLVDKVLLNTPESEINRRQIAIKDLILLQEAKERIWNKDAEALGRSSSNQSSTSSLPRKRNIDDFDFFGDAEENHDNEETNPNIQKSSKKLNYHSYMNRSKSAKWSKSETELFYQAMRQFGTDFAMIQKLFPDRTRHQVKLKYKYEERNNPMQLDDIFRHRPKDHSHFEKIIQLLQIQADQDPQKDAFENQEATASLDNSYENEEMIDGDNKGEESCGWAGQSHSPINSNIRNQGAQSPTETNDFEGLFDWDLEDMEEDIFNHD